MLLDEILNKYIVFLINRRPNTTPSYEPVQYCDVFAKTGSVPYEKKTVMLREGYDPPISRSLKAKRATARQNPMSLAP